jgi:hypothetical protein
MPTIRGGFGVERMVSAAALLLRFWACFWSFSSLHCLFGFNHFGDDSAIINWGFWCGSFIWTNVLVVKLEIHLFDAPKAAFPLCLTLIRGGFLVRFLQMCRAFAPGEVNLADTQLVVCYFSCQCHLPVRSYFIVKCFLIKFMGEQSSELQMWIMWCNECAWFRTEKKTWNI